MIQSQALRATSFSRNLSTMTSRTSGVFFGDSALHLIDFHGQGSANLSTITSPSADSVPIDPPPNVHPLELLRQESQNRNRCDHHGYRIKGAPWSFSLALNTAAPNTPTTSPPNLRTVGFQRVSVEGIEFLLKKGAHSQWLLDNENNTSIMFTEGKYRAGETVEQWRLEGGQCQSINVLELLQHVGKPVIVGMIASRRMEMENKQKEKLNHGSIERQYMADRSHFIELVQKTREQVLQDEISNHEIVDSLVAVRFHPHRIERMVGGPDHVMWNRWEWYRLPTDSSTINTAAALLQYDGPKQILPY